MDERVDRLLAWSRGEHPGPYAVTLDPQDRCDLGCCRCELLPRVVNHAQGTTQGLEPAELLELAREGAHLGVRSWIVSMEDERLLHAPQALQAIAVVQASGGRLHLRAGGTLARPVHARRMVAMGWDSVELSLDGADPRTHDQLHGYPEAFDRAVALGARLRRVRDQRRARRPELRWRTLLTRESFRHLPILLKLAEAEAVARWRVELPAPCGGEGQELRLQPEEREELLALLYRTLQESVPFKVRTNLRDMARLLEHQILEEAPPLPGTAQLPVRCFDPWLHIAIGPDGAISPCRDACAEGVNLHPGGLEQAWLGPYMTRVRREALLGKVPVECAEASATDQARNRRIHRRLLAALPPGERLKLHRRWLEPGKSGSTGARGIH